MFLFALARRFFYQVDLSGDGALELYQTAQLRRASARVVSAQVLRARDQLQSIKRDFLQYRRVAAGLEHANPARRDGAVCCLQTIR